MFFSMNTTIIHECLCWLQKATCKIHLALFYMAKCAALAITINNNPSKSKIQDTKQDITEKSKYFEFK